ncbi:MAG: alpha/beta hydrolase [Lactobacillus sp.]|nr:alpha/beta hydrolase [Lactobacillus sp.]
MQVSKLLLKNKNGRQYEMDFYQLTEIAKLKDDQHPLMLILPGGSFNHLSIREGEAIALAYLHYGFQAAVLKYNLIQDGPVYPDAYQSVLDAISYFRQNATELKIDPNRIVTIGFSAGGHVATTANNFADDSNRPNLTILGYPLISFGKIGFEIPTEAQKLFPKEKEIYDTSLGVNEKTPASFIFHASDDKTVDVQNSLEYALALAEHHVPCETHIYRNGGHGFGLATPEQVVHGREFTDNPHVSTWFKLSLEWLRLSFEKHDFSSRD